MLLKGHEQRKGFMNRALLKPQVWLVLLLAGGLFALGASSFVRRVGAAEPLLGAEWAGSREGPLAVQIDPESPAWRAGKSRHTPRSAKSASTRSPVSPTR